jgi:hypothetical protein
MDINFSLKYIILITLDLFIFIGLTFSLKDIHETNYAAPKCLVNETYPENQSDT